MSKKAPKKARATRRTPKPIAPAAVQQLAGRFLLGLEKDTINAAYAQAVRLLHHDHMHEPNEDVAQYVEGAMVAEFDEIDEAIRQSDVYGKYSDNIASAIMEPSFCLAFSLAYLLFTEK